MVYKSPFKNCLNCGERMNGIQDYSIREHCYECGGMAFGDSTVQTRIMREERAKREHNE